MPTEDEIRGLKRELAGVHAQNNPEYRSQIIADLQARGVKSEAPVEKRSPGRPKKTAE